MTKSSFLETFIHARFTPDVLAMHRSLVMVRESIGSDRLSSDRYPSSFCSSSGSGGRSSSSTFGVTREVGPGLSLRSAEPSAPDTSEYTTHPAIYLKHCRNVNKCLPGSLQEQGTSRRLFTLKIEPMVMFLLSPYLHQISKGRLKHTVINVLTEMSERTHLRDVSQFA